MNRRDAIKSVAAAGALAALPKFSMAEIGKKSKTRVGLIGCSGRGLSAVGNLLEAAKGSAVIVAMADLFPDRLDVADEAFKKHAKKYGAECFDIPQSRKYSGWDAYKQILTDDVDVIIHATPPVFRPLHLRAIVEAGKHMFVEKPACVDPVQARELYEIADLADKKGITIIPGVQRRFHPGYQEAVQRVRDGQIGDIVSAQAYWLNSRFFIQNNGNLYLHNTDPNSMEYQIRNWFIFKWASGDCYVEQHVHSLDVINWILGDPKEVNGVGGRRWDLPFPEMGDRFSHFAVDYDYGNGLHCSSYSRREAKSKDFVVERIVGTKGILETHLDSGMQRIIGKNEWRSDCKVQALVEEHRVLLDCVQNNKQLNMLREMVSSTLMAIAGRESCFSGQNFKFDWIKHRSKQSLAPKEWKFGENKLDGIPLPGLYQLS